MVWYGNKWKCFESLRVNGDTAIEYYVYNSVFFFDFACYKLRRFASRSSRVFPGVSPITAQHCEKVKAGPVTTLRAGNSVVPEKCKKTVGKRAIGGVWVTAKRVEGVPVYTALVNELVPTGGY